MATVFALVSSVPFASTMHRIESSLTLMACRSRRRSAARQPKSPFILASIMKKRRGGHRVGFVGVNLIYALPGALRIRLVHVDRKSCNLGRSTARVRRR